MLIGIELTRVLGPVLAMAGKKYKCTFEREASTSSFIVELFAFEKKGLIKIDFENLDDPCRVIITIAKEFPGSCAPRLRIVLQCSMERIDPVV